uniref:Large ribosomal subunit protein bL28c n=1 Tax=Picea sitchensis TaxID=3332 RepID=A9P1F4_PICSI|nr:unknown [Picea sitchensis]
MATVLLSRLASCIRPTTETQNPSMPTPKASSLSSANSELLRGSGFSSLKLSCQGNAKLVATSTAVVVQPLASRVCPLTGKRANNANKVSFSNHKTKKLQGVNLQYKRIWWEAGKRFVKLRISTKALKTIEKKGLDAMAKKAGIDLKKL